MYLKTVPSIAYSGMVIAEGLRKPAVNINVWCLIRASNLESSMCMFRVLLLQ